MSIKILSGPSLSSGLSIGAESLDIVVEEKGADKSISLKYFSEPFVYSGDKIDKESFKISLKNLLSNIKSLPSEVNIALPQNMVTTELITFSELPKSRSEVIEIVRWQAAKNAYLDPQLFHCDYTVVSRGKGYVRVLSVLVDKLLMDFIEKTLFEMDIVVTSTFPQVIAEFNFAVSNIKDDNFVKTSVNDGFFTAFVVKNAELVMFRTKPVDKYLDVAGEINATVNFYKQVDPDFNEFSLHYFGDENNVKIKGFENINITGCKDFDLDTFGKVNALLAHKHSI